MHTPACARLSPPPRSCILGLKWVKRHTGNLSPGGCELSRGEAGQPAATGQSAGVLSLLSQAPSRPGSLRESHSCTSLSEVGAGGDISCSWRVPAPTFLRCILVLESPDSYGIQEQWEASWAAELGSCFIV